MPRTGDIYAVPAGTKGVTLQTIQSGKYNAFLDDISADLNAARPVIAGGTGATTSDGAAKGLGLVSAKDLAGVNTVGGTANAITIVTDRDYDAYADTIYLTFKAQSNITDDGVTIDLDGLGAKSAYKSVSAGYVALSVGDIRAGGIYTLLFDTGADGGDGAFIVVNPSFSATDVPVGRFIDTVEAVGSKFLRRNGGVYDRDEYPELAALFPPLPDSMTWGTATFDSTPPSGYSCRGIVQFGTKRIAAFNNGSGLGMLLYSSDDAGASWTVRYSSSTKNVGELVAGNNEVVAFARDTTGVCSAVKSMDGISWTSNNVPGTANFNVSGAYTSSYFDGTNYLIASDDKVFRSTDAVTWLSTARTGRIIVAAPSKALLVDSGSYYQSSDHGATWSALGSNPFAAYTAVNVGLWDGVRNLFIYGTGATAGNIVTAPDGVTLTSRHAVASAGWYRGSTSVNGVIMGGLNLGSVAISANGLSYSNFATPGSGTTGGVLCDGEVPGRFLVGRGNTIYFGTRISSTQFRVPDDGPTYGWIRAVP